MIPTPAPPISITDTIQLGGDRLVIFAGPCAIESEEITLTVAEQVKRIGDDLDIDVVFKSSFDKANRTSISSYRSAGLEEGLRILQKAKDQFDLPLITDIHESAQVEAVAEVVDVLQIPAFFVPANRFIGGMPVSPVGRSTLNADSSWPHEICDLPSRKFVKQVARIPSLPSGA